MYLRYVGLLYTTLLQIYCQVKSRNNSDNWSSFGSYGQHIVAPFSKHGVVVTCKHIS